MEMSKTIPLGGIEWICALLFLKLLIYFDLFFFSLLRIVHENNKHVNNTKKYAETKWPAMWRKFKKFSLWSLHLGSLRSMKNDNIFIFQRRFVSFSFMQIDQ